MLEIQAWLAPLAGFWIIWDSLLKAAATVNGMRETIVSGQIGTISLTPEHRRAIFWDWQLSMAGTIFAAFLFGVLIAWIGNHLVASSSTAAVGQLMWGVSSLPFLGGSMFILCGISDWKLITQALTRADKGGSGVLSVNEGSNDTG